MYNFNEQFRFLESDRDITDALFDIFFMNQQARKRNEAGAHTKPNQRS